MPVVLENVRSHVSLDDWLVRLTRCVREANVDDAVAGMLPSHPGANLPPRRLVDMLRRQFAQEEEGPYSPGWRFAGAIARQAGSDCGVISRAAEQYITRTRYLFPILERFGHSVTCVARGRPIVLFLRDALAVWPALAAHRPPGGVRFLAYTRRHHERGMPPRLVQPNGDGDARIIECPELQGSLLIDIGIWGSLALRLLRDGHCTCQTAVLFLGTRNPLVEGWANARMTPHLLDGAAVDPRDVVRLVDTVESLLKPFTFDCAGEPSETLIRLADPISLACSAAFAWSLHDYAVRHAADNGGQPEWFDLFTGAKDDPRAWCVREDLPKSQDGPQLLRDWTFGPLPPRDTCCGFSL